MDSLLRWVRVPDGLGKHLGSVGLILCSQVFLRLYQIIDNHYLAQLGSDALLLHNILQNLNMVGQFLGIGVALSCLIFWKSPEAQGKQGSIFLVHLILALVSSGFFSALFLFSSPFLLKAFQVPNDLWPLALFYFKVGAFNTCLYTCYLTLDGLLIATNQQKMSLFLALFLAFGNFCADSYAVGLAEQIPGEMGIVLPLHFFAISTTGLMITAVLLASIWVYRKAQGWNFISWKSFGSVWVSELGLAVIRSTSILFLGYLIGGLQASVGFIVTYHLLCHLSYLATLPLGAGMQLALRDAASETRRPALDRDTGSRVLGLFRIPAPPRWWNLLLYSSILPTVFMFLIAILFSRELFNWVYGYQVPEDHSAFIRPFFFAGLMTQFSRVPSLVLRALKKSKSITQSFLFSECILTLGGTQLLIILGSANPRTFAAVLVFSAVCLIFLISVQWRIALSKLAEVPLST